jgi:cell wall assembly regulator SMI1
MSSLTERCARLQLILERHDPKRLAGLQPEIPARKLERLIKQFPYRLPDDYLLFLQWHNGEGAYLAGGEVREKGIIWGPSSRMYPLEVALETYQNWRQLNATYTVTSEVQQPAHSICEGWWPFAQGQHQTWLMDMVPGAGGQVGQVISSTGEFSREQAPNYHVHVAHASFSDWLESCVRKFETFFA